MLHMHCIRTSFLLFEDLNGLNYTELGSSDICEKGSAGTCWPGNGYIIDLFFNTSRAGLH